MKIILEKEISEDQYKPIHLDFDDYLAQQVGIDRAKRMIEAAENGNEDAMYRIKELRELHERDLDMKRDEFESGKDIALGKVIRSNLVNQRLDEIDPRKRNTI